MIDVAPGLLGLAALCADRSWRSARRAAVMGAIGLTAATPPRRVPVAAWHVLAAAGGWAFAGIWGAGLASAGLVAVRTVRSHRRARLREAERARQLADAVGSLAAAMRSGRSVLQAIGTTAQEVDEPLSGSLREIEDELASGRPFEDAVRTWARRLGTDEAALVAGTLLIHRQIGGDLPSVLDRVAETLSDRAAIAAEVRSMTAQARLSGAVVGALPVVFLGVLWLVSRDDVLLGLASPVGKGAVVIGLVLEVGAYLWIRRLLEVR